MKELLDTGVHISLEYYESDDALIGSVKGYSAAVRENLKTGSYGALLWVKPEGASKAKDAEAYLRARQGEDPELIKNFVVTDLGAAVALNRRGDAFTDINALKRFLYDLADFFAANGFVNCCCRCGSELDLGIYAADSVITQTCASCAAGYRPIIPSIKTLERPAPFRPIPKAPEPAKTEEAPAKAEEIPAKAAELPKDDMSDYLESIRAKSREFEEAAAAKEPEPVKEADDFPADLLIQPEPAEETSAPEANTAEAAVIEPDYGIPEDLLVQPGSVEEPQTAPAEKMPAPETNIAEAEADGPDYDSLEDLFVQPESIEDIQAAAEEKASRAREADTAKAAADAAEEALLIQSDVLNVESFEETPVHRRWTPETNTDSLPVLEDMSYTESAPEAPAPKKTVPNPDGNKGAAYDDIFDNFMFEEEEEEKPAPKSELFEQIEREYAEEQAAMALEGGIEEEDDAMNDLLFDSLMDAPEEVTQDVIREEKKEKVPDIAFTELLINEGGQIEVKEAERELDDGTVVTEIHDDSNDGEDIDVTEIASTVNDPTITTGDLQLEAEDTPLEIDGSVPLVNPTANREEKQVSSVDGPDAVTALEEQINRYSQQVHDDGPFAKGFATADNMIDRDAPVTYSDRKRKKYDKPVEYDYNREYALRQGKNDGVYTQYSHSISHMYSKPVKGFIGSLLIGLVGVAAWLLFAYFLNEISWMGAFAAVVASFLGYYLIGGALDKKGIVISLFIALLLTFAGSAAVTLVSFRVEIMNAVGENSTVSDIMTFYIKAVTSQNRLRTEFLGNMICSYAVTGITSIVATAILWRRTF